MTETLLPAFGEDRVERGPGEEAALLCPVSKPSWTPRREKTLTTAAYPGTAVEWNGQIFEVRRAQPLPEGGMRYVLAPWDEGHAIRRLERYDAESERGRSDTRNDLASRVRRRRASILLAPLAGFLPGNVQKEMESEFGAPAIAMTIASALPLAVIGFLGLLDRLLGMFGGPGAGLGFPVWLAPPYFIALYLFGESALRLGSAIAMEEPMGSFPVVVCYAAWREAREPRLPPPGADVSAERRGRDASDRFRMLEPLLALLSAAEQETLTRRFGFEPVRWGRITAAILLVLSGTNFLVAIMNLSAGTLRFADGLWLLAGGALTGEQIRRLRLLAAKRPAGSLLAFLVRPLAKPLLTARA
jgi:hypothetical protein